MKRNWNHFTSGCTHWYHSEMLTQNEHSALNLNQSLSRSLSTPSLVSVVISAHRGTRHSWTQNNVWVWGALDRAGSIFGCDHQPPSLCCVTVCGWCLINCGFVDHSVVAQTREGQEGSSDDAAFIQIDSRMIQHSLQAFQGPVCRI